MMKVAEQQMDRAVKAEGVLKLLIDAFDAGSVGMESADISINGDHAPHPWHEEWLYRARAAVSRS